MMKVLILCMLMVAGISCIAKKKAIQGIFAGNVHECQKVYIFSKKNIYAMEISGCEFRASTKGNFFIKADTLYLEAWPKARQPSGQYPAIAKEAFLIYNDSCIINILDGYDYCRVKSDTDYLRASSKKLLSELHNR